MKSTTPDMLTGREHFLIGKALVTAARALRAQQNPPEADIAGMNDLLERYYPSHKQMYDELSDLQLALRAGYKPEPGLRRDGDVRKWLDKNLPGGMSNVTDIRDVRSKHEQTADKD